MTSQDFEQFGSLLAGLGEVFDKKVTKLLVEVYWQALRRYPMSQVREAINRAVVTFKFFPRPAELIELITGNSDDQAERAWGLLLDAIRYAGAYCSVIFEDGRIARAVELMGGWEEVTGWTVDELKFRHREFIGIFKSLPSKMPARKLAGFFERDNRAKGMDGEIYPEITCPTVLVSETGILPAREAAGTQEELEDGHEGIIACST